MAAAARESLQNAARVEIPKRSFVMWVVAVYLLVLVPANWAVFRGLRRVEWAWAAAPVIAVVCTGTVIRMAQLDIGFVRSQTELAVLEMQGDYARGHVTRYNALYTSLATSYNFRCDDPGAVVLPFPTVAEPELFRMSLGQQIRKLTYRRGEQAVLRAFRSDRTPPAWSTAKRCSTPAARFRWSKAPTERSQLVNRSALNLHGVGLVAEDPFGRVAGGMGGRAFRARSRQAASAGPRSSAADAGQAALAAAAARGVADERRPTRPPGR